MLALLIIPLLVSGYFFITIGKFKKLNLYRFTGQLLYLKTIAYGGIFFIASLSLMIYVDIFHPALKPYMINLVRQKYDIANNLSISLIFLSIISIFLSLISSVLIHCWHSLREDSPIATNLNSSPKYSLESLLLTSIMDKKVLLFNLDSGKIYAGIVMELSEQTENNEPGAYITIYPMMSGYRDKDTQKEKFTKSYSSEDNQDTDFAVMLFREQLTHISFFDMDYYLSELTKEMLTIKNKIKTSFLS